MKGIIIAAGYGTRFLPVTKTIPKEMLPLINKPAIAFIVEEFIASGIDEIIIISSRRKKAMEDYFDREVELESKFISGGNDKKLKAIENYPARFCFVRQQEMRGTGHAMLQAAYLLGGSPAVVAYPDDLHFGEKPLTAQLIEMHKQSSCSVMASLYNPPNLNRYGVFDLAEDGKHIKGIVEKPEKGKEPSQEVSIGRYLYSAEYFQLLAEGWEKHQQAGNKGEYFPTYALNRLMAQDKIMACRFSGERLDIGEPEGFIRAMIAYAKTVPEYWQILQKELSKK